jgi:hypothetical protein
VRGAYQLSRSVPTLTEAAPQFTRFHGISRRSPHSRPTDPLRHAVSPGQGSLTASLATRGSRVQIPSAPLKTLVRELSDASGWSLPAVPAVWRSTHDPQDSGGDPLIFCEGVNLERLES